MELRAHLGKVRGLGSNNSGSKHWWSQRVSGIALIPLTLWFLMSIINIFNADLAAFKDWINYKANAALLSLLITFMFYHGFLGLQVIIEDYIHQERVKISILLICKFIIISFGTYSIFSIIKLTFGG